MSSDCQADKSNVCIFVNVQNGLSPLHIAIYNHQNIACSDLLEHEVDVNVGDKMGNTPLMLACELGHTDLVDMLLDYDADSDIKNLEGMLRNDKYAIKFLVIIEFNSKGYSYHTLDIYCSVFYRNSELKCETL